MEPVSMKTVMPTRTWHADDIAELALAITAFMPGIGPVSAALTLLAAVREATTNDWLMAALLSAAAVASAAFQTVTPY